MPWPLERSLIAAARAPDGTVHCIVYTSAGNYMFACGAVMHEMETVLDAVTKERGVVQLNAMSHRAARKIIVNEHVDCMACLDMESRGLLEDP